MSIGIINQGSIASVYMDQGKKAAVASAAASIISAASAGAGCIIRVLDMTGSTQITIGNSSLELDSGTAPGALILSAVNEGLTLNITGDVYAICDAGSANLAVTPLRISGMANSGG